MATYVREMVFPPVENMGVEIVERKGLGHPDTICDALSEAYSSALSRAYMERFGRVYHHNVDKALLVGGEAKPALGGGEVISPIEIYMVGRATAEVKGERVPVDEIYYQSAKGWIRKNFRYLDPDKHLDLRLVLRPGSQDLVELFDRSHENPLANDTSFGVGFAPMTTTEQLVYHLEKHLNSDFRKRHSFVGEDIKVMAVRIGRRTNLTVAMATVGKELSSLEDYLEAKETVRQECVDFAAKINPWQVLVDVNAADSPERESVYITVTGTSAEAGDDGQVGRGNRAHGLITPMRPMSLEAAAGKNPVSHVGKTYNVLAREIAQDIVRRMDEVTEAYVYIVSQIGKPVTEPQLLDIHLRPRTSLSVGTREHAAEIAERKLQDAPVVWRRVLAGEVELF